MRSPGPDLSRWVVGLSAAEGEAGLRRLARLLHEAAGAFYLDDARRRIAAHAERRAAPPELSTRVAFKARARRRSASRVYQLSRVGSSIACISLRRL